MPGNLRCARMHAVPGDEEAADKDGMRCDCFGGCGSRFGYGDGQHSHDQHARLPSQRSSHLVLGCLPGQPCSDDSHAYLDEDPSLCSLVKQQDYCMNPRRHSCRNS